MKKLGVALAALTASMYVGQSSAETTECSVISSIPTTITERGVYCLKSNLADSSGNSDYITIATNNVTIDLNGYVLAGLAAGQTSTSVGIYGQNVKNLTIRNGVIRGFREGVVVTGADSFGALIEDVIFDQNIHSAIVVSGAGAVVRNNRVVKTLNTGAVGVPWVYAINASSDGVGTGAEGVKIIGNYVSDTTGSGGNNVGIYTIGNSAVIRGNIIDGMDGFGNYGVFSSISEVLIDNNVILGLSGAGSTQVGIRSVSGLCRDNSVLGVPDANSGCIDFLGNRFVDAPALAPEALSGSLDASASGLWAND